MIDDPTDLPWMKEKRTLGQYAADKMTEWVGSWAFIILLLVFMGIWIAVNLYAWFMVWDPYPFILLNFVLSTLAAIQAPIILMSQNREAERDRLTARYDYEVDRRAEAEVADMQRDLDEIKHMLKEIKKELRRKKS